MEALPQRLPLVQGPTALHRLPRLTEYFGGPEIWVKRDDNTGLALGGNKARKLEFLLHDAQEKDCTDVITVGGIQSNHARMTAAAAASLGLACHLVLRGKDRSLQGNLLLDRQFGAELYFLDPGQDREAHMAALAQELKNQGRRPYTIGVGGSNALGSLGYVKAAEELMGQLNRPDFFDETVAAVGSGGTYAGLWIGAAAYCWRTRLQGIAVDGEPFAEIIQAIAQDAAASYGTPLPRRDSLLIDDSYIGGGYSIPTDEGVEAIQLFSRLEGILLDPTYTGKAAAGLIDRVRSGVYRECKRILFWHTGGAPALFASAELLS